MEQVKDQIREIVANATDLEFDEFKDNDHLYKDLGADSVVGFEIIVKIQKAFNIYIDDKEAPTLMSVNKMYDTVLMKISSN